jgi:lipopolysaccharide export system permease protein
MFDGIAQTVTREEDPRLSITRFADLTYDLGGMIDLSSGNTVSIDTVSTIDLLGMDAAERETRLGVPVETVLETIHSRLAQPFLGAATALVGFAALLIGAFSRFGLWRQILGAVGILIFLQLLNTTGTSLALGNAAAWPAVYAAPVAGLGIGVLLLLFAQRPRRRRRAFA